MSDAFGPAIRMQWDGESLIPSNQRWAQAADRQLIVGEHYMVREHAERSKEDHNHYFAILHRAWENLPEAHSGLPYSISAEHLRAYALIRCGYADVKTFIGSSKAEAQRIASFIRPMDEFALVTVDGSTVTRLTAQSQSKRAMGHETFHESKQKVLEFLADLIGISADELCAAQRLNDTAPNSSQGAASGREISSSLLPAENGSRGNSSSHATGANQRSYADMRG